jgi:hypothetical protein
VQIEMRQIPQRVSWTPGISMLRRQTPWVGRASPYRLAEIASSSTRFRSPGRLMTTWSDYRQLSAETNDGRFTC